MSSVRLSPHRAAISRAIVVFPLPEVPTKTSLGVIAELNASFPLTQRIRALHRE